MIGTESLTVKFAGLKFRNPTMLASGFLGISQEILDRIYLSGAGCLVSKSLSNLPIEGYRNPTVIDLNGKTISTQWDWPIRGSKPSLQKLKS